MAVALPGSTWSGSFEARGIAGFDVGAPRQPHLCVGCRTAGFHLERKCSTDGYGWVRRGTEVEFFGVSGKPVGVVPRRATAARRS